MGVDNLMWGSNNHGCPGFAPNVGMLSASVKIMFYPDIGGFNA